MHKIARNLLPFMVRNGIIKKHTNANMLVAAVTSTMPVFYILTQLHTTWNCPRPSMIVHKDKEQKKMT